MNIEDAGKRIEGAGGRLYFVGGGVRDQLMGKDFKDRDYAVTGLSAEEFKRLFPDAFLAGQAFPVFRMPIAGEVAEFALARTEKKVSTGHQGFEVDSSPSVSIEDDLMRRDLTINAIAMDVLSNEIVDPFGGRRDIDDGIIRAVSRAFAEDPLRVYRAARFAAQFGFRIERQTIGFMRALHDELRTLSVERVFEELRKALQTERPSLFFRALLQASVLDVHFPEVAKLVGVEQPVKWHPEGDAFEHTMQVLDVAAMLTDRDEVRFSALVHDLGKGITPRHKWPAHHGHEAAGVPLTARLCARLKLPSDWTNAALFATEHHMKIHILDRMKPQNVVTLLTEANRNPLGVDGFAMVGLADTRGRNDPTAPSPNAESMPHMWELIKNVTGRSIQTDATGKEFGDALRRERGRVIAEWRKQGNPSGTKK
ncbi:HD domain-containing protein [Alicyclobacillus dauci]|uniref:HD domain-containing protein n=1 Tax=Alicyclobacillus dauci TaxID=1475485 RepID=A0ABY6YZI9_9BACL|nr:HD domain-containing protein [Alicyclobacillus dauci]WAH36042.1 HD domain-containing protein [Alicyclobacillus dauci]